MKMIWEEDPATGSVKIGMRIDADDIIACEGLTPLHWEVFRECAKSHKISDRLIGLEVLARKIEESIEKKRREKLCNTQENGKTSNNPKG